MSDAILIPEGYFYTKKDNTQIPQWMQSVYRCYFLGYPTNTMYVDLNDGLNDASLKPKTRPRKIISLDKFLKEWDPNGLQVIIS